MLNFTSVGTVEVTMWVREGWMGGTRARKWMGKDLCEMSPALPLLKLSASVQTTETPQRKCWKSTEEIKITKQEHLTSSSRNI